MRVLYAQEEMESVPAQSIFLAGPSPGTKKHYNWRPEALEILEDIEFEGTVFVPLYRDGEWLDDPEGQMDWELKHLDMASVIVFWIPRDLETLPGFTTNVEYGLYLKSGKIVLGFPKGTPKIDYIEYIGKKNNVPVYYDLEETLRKAVSILHNPQP